jgi:amino acid transporter
MRSVGAAKLWGRMQLEIKEAEQRLRKDAIGLWTIVFFVVAAASPLPAMLGTVPIVLRSGNGVGAPAAWVLTGLVLVLFTVGYTTMSRHITNAGAFYAYIANGLGRPMGIGGALIALLSYNAIQISLYGLLGFFLKLEIAEHFKVDIPWWVYAVLAAVICYLCGMRHVEFSGWLLGLFMLCEVGILFLLDLAVIRWGGAEGLSLSSFAPHNVFSKGLGVTLVFAVACYVGFEATTNFSEEARDAKRTVPVATYVAVLLIMVFYTLSSWAVVNGYGPSHVVSVATQDSGNFWFALNDRYVGRISTDLMQALLITSIFAGILSFHNTITRYIFAMGREGLVWRPLANTHPQHQSPYIAGMAQTLVELAVIAVFAGTKQDPYAILFAWMSAIATLGILITQVLVSLAVIGFFRRTRLDRRVWHTIVSPTLAAVGLIVFFVLVWGNLGLLSGSESPVVRAFPYLVLGVGVVGVMLGYYLRAKKPRLYEGFGSLIKSV